ncbi:MAG: potassium transporter KtrB [Rhodobacteraceae bacterium]|nr:potassium transporter KtrB [Paracoccaceae bacterium]
MARIRMRILKAQPARTLLAGYAFYILAGWALLSLPLAQEAAVAPIDALFISASAVSTTGLVTVDPGSAFSPFGEVVILVLIQLGGLGYMTVGSFALLALTRRLGPIRARATRAAFGLPEGIGPAFFLRSVVLFTLAVELAGAFVLAGLFFARGVPDPVWSGLFHSVSAFCTAGFSLFPDSFERFRHDPAILFTLSALSILGSVGFLIVVDIWYWTVGRAARLGFTSAVILRTTCWLIGFGTLLFFLTDPATGHMIWDQRLLNAFFQAMSASTTVGFNSVPIGGTGTAALFVLILLMVVGASPAGTGGGFKTTSLAVILGLIASVLRGRPDIRLCGRRLGEDRIHLAAASLAFYLGMMALAVLVLGWLEPAADFEAVVFEAVSAMSTVGLSMGLTGSLGDAGKLVVIVLMFAGRVGFLTFGIALALRDRAQPAREEGELVL